MPTLQPEVVKNIESTVGNSPPAIDIPTLELRVHELINQQRRSNGLSSLSDDSSLASIAENIVQIWHGIIIFLITISKVLTQLGEGACRIFLLQKLWFILHDRDSRKHHAE